MTNVQSTHYVIGSVVGPAPYPALVRDLQRVIGDEARAQMLEREGRLPARVIACVGGGSNAIGIFAAFIPDEQVELVGVEAGGEGIDTSRHGAPLTVGGRPGILHGSRSAVMQDEEGQIVQAHSVSAGPGLPGRGPAARPPARQRPRALRGGDRRARRSPRSARSRAWRASSRRSRPRTRSPGCSPQPEGELDLVCLSGRGDKDLAEVLGRGRGVSTVETTGIERIAEAFARSGKRAALMPYVMGGLPDARGVAADRSRRACAAGADVIELGMPYSDPLADGPVIHAAGTRALAAGANVAGVLEVARALAGSVPVVLMCYANMVFAPGVEAFVERLARTGACGLIVPDLPQGEAPEVLEACDARGLALVPLVAPTTTPERLAAIGARARGLPLHGLGRRHHRRAPRARRALRGGRRAGEGEHARCRSRSASGSARPSRPLQAADAGADGVIVGTRLVRAAGESEDPASAVGVARGRTRGGSARRSDRPARIPRAWD